ncbi:MAG: peptidyl-prolyl cis-trans isomerase [Thermoanaerobaculia bacterium]
MLKVFRDNMKALSWVLWLVIAVFILFVFVDFGSTVPANTGGTDVAAKVGSQTVSYGEFESAYRRMEDFYRQTYGNAFNADFARQIGLHRQVLDTLVADRILLLEAERLGLEVTDDELQTEILNLPVFQADEGGFIGAGDYERILRQNNYTVDAFEAGMRQDLLLSKVRAMVTQNLYIPEAEVQDEYRRQIEKAKVRFFRAPFSVLANDIELDETAIEAYYSDNSASFETPERRVVDYLLVDTEQIRNAIRVEPDELRAYYDENQDDFSQPEQVRARHILLQVNADRSADQARSELENAKQRILAGEDFAALAAELSEDPGSKQRGGDLGLFGRGAMVEGFENAAFSTAPGELAGPVQTDFGYHLIEVLERNDGGLRPYQEVESLIEQRLLGERSREVAEEKAQELSQKIASSELDLGGLAESEDGVTFQTTPPFAVDENVPSVGRATPFANAAFDLETGAVSDPVRLARGWAILSVVEVQEPRIPPLGEVRADVESALRVERQRQVALERLTAERHRGLDAIAESVGLQIEEPESFGLDGVVGTLGADARVVDAALELDEGDLGGPIATDEGAVMFEVVERQRMDPAEFENQKSATRASLESRRAAQLVAALVAERRKQLDVTLDPQLLANFGIEASGSASG